MNIAFTETQSKNQAKLSESFGKLGSVQKISTAPADGQGLDEDGKANQANS